MKERLIKAEALKNYCRNKLAISGTILGEARGSGQGSDTERRSVQLRLRGRPAISNRRRICVTFQHMPLCKPAQENKREVTHETTEPIAESGEED